MKTVLVILILLISGCAEMGSIRSGIANHGANAADQALESAEWGLCKSVTMGAWQRRYGNSPVKAEGWRKLCSTEVGAP